MKLILALAIVAALLGIAPAFAFECPEDRTVYVRDQTEIRVEVRSEEEPFGLFLNISVDSHTVRFATGSGGTGIIWRVAYDPISGKGFPYLIRDDQHLEFDGKLFSPVCRE